ncbi:unnamed protein product, partial [Scytosiphon promiscuus]
RAYPSSSDPRCPIGRQKRPDAGESAMSGLRPDLPRKTTDAIGSPPINVPIQNNPVAPPPPAAAQASPVSGVTYQQQPGAGEQQPPHLRHLVGLGPGNQLGAPGAWAQQQQPQQQQQWPHGGNPNGTRSIPAAAAVPPSTTSGASQTPVAAASRGSAAAAAAAGAAAATP